MEVEAITHALRWFSLRQSDHTCPHPHRFSEVATERKKERKKETNKQKQNKNKQTNKKTKTKQNKKREKKVEWEAGTEMCQLSTSTFENSCGCTALDMPEWREMTEQVDWRENQPSQMACILEDPRVLRSLRHYLQAQSQGHHTICHLEERGVERGSARRSSLKGRERPSSVRQTLEPFQRQRWGNFWETGWKAYGLFRARRYHLEPKGASLSLFQLKLSQPFICYHC